MCNHNLGKCFDKQVSSAMKACLVGDGVIMRRQPWRKGRSASWEVVRRPQQHTRGGNGLCACSVGGGIAAGLRNHGEPPWMGAGGAGSWVGPQRQAGARPHGLSENFDFPSEHCLCPPQVMLTNGCVGQKTSAWFPVSLKVSFSSIP